MPSFYCTFIHCVSRLARVHLIPDIYVTVVTLMSTQLLSSNGHVFKDYIHSLCDDRIQNLNASYLDHEEFNIKFCNPVSGNLVLSVCHLNIRSLNANHGKLQQLLLSINLQFDLIILSEIWRYNIDFSRIFLIVIT